MDAYEDAACDHRHFAIAANVMSVVQTIHISTLAMLQTKMNVQENTLPYSKTSGCLCISERNVKQTWKHHVKPTANIHAHGAGNGMPGYAK